MKPLRFEPYYKSVVWGGSEIGAFKGASLPSNDIGESWEISGYKGHVSRATSPEEVAGLSLDEIIAKYGSELMGSRVYKKTGNRFPLILKILDARRDLSVQVHPDDTAAKAIGEPNGKTEMWYVLESMPSAAIYAGFKSTITHDDLKRHVAENTLMDVVERHSPSSGDVYFLPAGQVHAIGAGNLLLEIQQNSDITYRLYDYGRLDADGNPRPLHLAEALEVISLDNNPGVKLSKFVLTDNGHPILCECQYFRVVKIDVKGEDTIVNRRDSFMIVFCADGNIEITDNENHTEIISRGQTILYPATSTELSVKGKGTLLTFTL